MRARRTAAVGAALRWSAHRFPFVSDEVAALRAFVPAGSVCVDAGAEYGLYTWVPAALAGPSGRVHSVEPLPGPCHRLRVTGRLLGARNVTVRRATLGDRCGRGRLSLPVRRGLPVHGRAHLADGARGPGPDAEFRASRTVEAPVRTLDQLAHDSGPQRPGLRQGRRRRHRTRRAEGWFGHLRRHLAKYGVEPGEVLGRLRDFGYQPHRRPREGWVPVTHVTDDCRNYLFTA